MKNSPVKWTICIATTWARAEKLERLMKLLVPQVDKHKGKIEVLIFWNNFEYSLGYIRQSMLDDARGEYISSIDDDDLVTKDFCDTILPLLDGVDYIGFQVDFYDGGKKKPPVYHNLDHQDWYEDETGYYRGVTHLNPVRTELARESKFPTNFNMGEDHQWTIGMKNLCKTQHVIDRPMYIYEHNADDSYSPNAGYSDRQSDTPIRPVLHSKNVRFHPKSTPNAKAHI
jgi:hypothetical protein